MSEESFADDLAAMGDTADQDYHADPAWSQSAANQLLNNSPRHAFEYRRRNAEKRGKADPDHDRPREMGTVVHKLLLGSTVGFRELPYDNYLTKVAKERRTACEVEGVTPILSSDLVKCRRSATALTEQLKEEFGIELDGVSELPLFWSESGLDCKAKIDHLCADGFTILDVKSGSDANPKGLVRRILDQGCHVQAAAYLRALYANRPETRGRGRFIDLFIETGGLNLVTPVEITGSLLELGDRAWVRSCAKWSQCVDSGYYPGYVTSIIAPPAPEWVLKEEMSHHED